MKTIEHYWTEKKDVGFGMLVELVLPFRTLELFGEQSLSQSFGRSCCFRMNIVLHGHQNPRHAFEEMLWWWSSSYSSESVLTFAAPWRYPWPSMAQKWRFQGLRTLLTCIWHLFKSVAISPMILLGVGKVYAVDDVKAEKESLAAVFCPEV